MIRTKKTHIALIVYKYMGDGFYKCRKVYDKKHKYEYHITQLEHTEGKQALDEYLSTVPLDTKLPH